jgi:hypothetical protein
MLHLEACTDVIAGRLPVVWVLVESWHMDGTQRREGRPSHA